MAYLVSIATASSQNYITHLRQGLAISVSFVG